MNLDTENILKKANSVFMELQKEEYPQQVSEIDAFKAYLYIKYLPLESSQNLFTMCASLNLLNRYVKQNKKSISYSFKNYLTRVIDYIIQYKPSDIIVDLQDNNLLIIQFGKVQFSFHNVNRDICDAVNSSRISRHLEWDGIRKQYCAASVFEYGELFFESACSNEVNHFRTKLKKATDSFGVHSLILGYYGPCTPEQERINTLKRNIIQKNKGMRSGDKSSKESVLSKYDLNNDIDRKRIESMLNNHFSTR